MKYRKNKIGKNYDEIFGRIKATKIRKKMGMSQRRRYAKNGHFNKGKHLSEEWKNAIRDANRGLRRSDKFRELMRKIGKKRWKDPEYQKRIYRAMRRKPNISEAKLNDILQENFPNKWKYVGDYKMFFGRKNPDFINTTGQKKLIELFSFWHRRSGIPFHRTRRGTMKYYRNYGFSTLIIDVKELSNRNDVISKIEKFNEVTPTIGV